MSKAIETFGCRVWCCCCVGVHTKERREKLPLVDDETKVGLGLVAYTHYYRPATHLFSFLVGIIIDNFWLLVLWCGRLHHHINVVVSPRPAQNMPKKKGQTSKSGSSSAAVCQCEDPYRCTCGLRPERPSKG